MNLKNTEKRLSSCQNVQAGYCGRKAIVTELCFTVRQCLAALVIMPGAKEEVW